MRDVWGIQGTQGGKILHMTWFKFMGVSNQLREKRWLLSVKVMCRELGRAPLKLINYAKIGSSQHFSVGQNWRSEKENSVVQQT